MYMYVRSVGGKRNKGDAKAEGFYLINDALEDYWISDLDSATDRLARSYPQRTVLLG